MGESLKFFATTAKAMEPYLASEIRALGGGDVVTARAGVFFTGSLETAYRACLWSRTANRILLPLKTFSAPTPEKLYGGVKSIRWSEHLTPASTIAVDFSSASSKISHSQFGALKTKDAIVDQFRSTQGARPSVDIKNPDLRVNVYLNRDEATVSIDLSGESLHRRGYREEGAFAPLKENLAAALLYAADWPKKVAEFGTASALMDPMCGSGTLPIEAAMMAANIAPGLRRRFGFEGWIRHEPQKWKVLVEEANEVQIRDPKKIPKIIGYDRDFRAVRAAIGNGERAGLRGKVHIEKRDLSACEPVLSQGVLITNPPYGERMGEVEELKTLYSSLGDLLKQKFKGWQAFVLTGNPELAKSVGLKASRRIPFFNGPIECRLLAFEVY